MKQSKRNHPKTAKAETVKPEEVKSTVPKNHYRFRKPSFAIKYGKAISYLYQLEESEIDLMVVSSSKVAASMQ